MATNLSRRIAALEDRLQLSKDLTMAEIEARLRGPPDESEEDAFLRLVNLIGVEALTEASWIDVDDEAGLLNAYNRGIKCSTRKRNRE